MDRRSVLLEWVLSKFESESGPAFECVKGTILTIAGVDGLLSLR